MAQEIARALRESKTIALVGASLNPDRPSNEVMAFLLARGYRVIPVNPGLGGKEIHGQKVFENLAAIDEPIDMVDIFRNSEAAAEVVNEALALSPLPKVIWMQLGVINDEAAERARAAGLSVIMNRCPVIELTRGTEGL